MVSVAGLKARLSEYLRRARSGEEITVTDRGTPIARLAPLESRQRHAARRDQLARSGALRLGRGRARKALLAPPLGKPDGAAVLAALLAERDEQR